MKFQDFIEPLNEIIPLHQRVSSPHPALKEYYPIAIVVDEQFLVFDFDSSRSSSKFKILAPTPMPVP